MGVSFILIFFCELLFYVREIRLCKEYVGILTTNENEQPVYHAGWFGKRTILQ